MLSQAEADQTIATAVMLEMKQNHHFPILDSRRIFGDCVVFLID